MPSLITVLGSCLVAASAAVAADRPANHAGEPWWSNPPAATSPAAGPKITEYGPAASRLQAQSHGNRAAGPRVGQVGRICSRSARPAAAAIRCPPPSNKIPPRRPAANAARQEPPDRPIAVGPPRARRQQPRPSASLAPQPASGRHRPPRRLRPRRRPHPPPPAAASGVCRAAGPGQSQRQECPGQEFAAERDDHGRRQPGDRAGAFLHRRLGHAQDRSARIAAAAQGGLRDPRPRPARGPPASATAALRQQAAAGLDHARRHRDPDRSDRSAGGRSHRRHLPAGPSQERHDGLPPGLPAVGPQVAANRRNSTISSPPARGGSGIAGRKNMLEREELQIANCKLQIANLQIASRSASCRRNCRSRWLLLLSLALLSASLPRRPGPRMRAAGRWRSTCRRN